VKAPKPCSAFARACAKNANRSPPVVAVVFVTQSRYRKTPGQLTYVVLGSLVGSRSSAVSGPPSAGAAKTVQVAVVVEMLP
jgi:hypothetical protein